MIPAYPLHWPAGWPRMRPSTRVRGRFGKGERKFSHSGESSWMSKRDMTVSDAVQRVRDELRKFGIDDQDVVISTNVRTRLDGLPRSGEREPDDPGVAVYWQYPSGDGRRCMAIDRYDRVADNLAAVAATLEAMRSIERHGGAQILDRAFTGFAALPAPDAARDWWDVLEVRRDATPEVIRASYRRLASDRHPDKGGSDAKMSELNRARDEALAYLEGLPV